MLGFFSNEELILFHKLKKTQRKLEIGISDGCEFYIVGLLSELIPKTPPVDPLYSMLDLASKATGVYKYLAFKDLGDHCLTVLTTYPKIIVQKGLSMGYYRDICIMAYSRAGSAADKHLDSDYANLMKDLSDSVFKIERLVRDVQGVTPGKVEGFKGG